MIARGTPVLATAAFNWRYMIFLVDSVSGSPWLRRDRDVPAELLPECLGGEGLTR